MTMISTEDRRDIQGIVTTGFGHLDHAGLLLVRFAVADGAMSWLGSLIPKITTAEPWEKDTRGAKRRPDHTVNIALTYGGVALLGLPREALNGLSTEFAVGMAKRGLVLGDHGKSSPDNWEIGGPKNDPVHALVVVFAPDREAVDLHLEDLRSTFGTGVVEVGTEYGSENTTFREHFGFSADGLSQPEIAGLRSKPEPGAEVVKAGEFLLGYINELGLYPTSPGVAAANDPKHVLPTFPEGALPGCRDFGRNASYMVYRKLEQDVSGFWQFLQSQTANRDGDLERQQQDMISLAAKFMGRWPSGAPLVLAPEYDDPALGKENDFLYRPSDPDGYACPFGSHIRRANPRDSIRRIRDTAEESVRTSNQHRVLRRGISYGAALFPSSQIEHGKAPLDLHDDGKPRGLHFLALNTDIQRQFEFVQQTWLNNQKFNGLVNNKDPILGDNDGTGEMIIQRSPVRRRVGSIPRFVDVRGGEYFFLPGLNALRYLAQPR